MKKQMNPISSNSYDARVYQHSKYGSCIQLNETNYLAWKLQIARLLKAANLYGLITKDPSDSEPQQTVTVSKTAYVEDTARPGVDTRAEQPNPKHQEWTKRAGEAYMLLTNCLSTSAQRALNHHGSAIAIWEAIQNSYGLRANHGIASDLFFKFTSLQMEKTENIQQWIDRLRPFQAQLENTPYAINDKIFRDKLLNGARDRCDVTVMSIRTTLSKQPDYSVEDIIDHLLQVDTRLYPDSYSSNIQANISLPGFKPTTSNTSGFRGRGNRRRGRAGRPNSNRVQKPITGDKNRSHHTTDVQCYYCTKSGHYEKDCRIRKAAEALRKGQNKTSHNSDHRAGLVLVPDPVGENSDPAYDNFFEDSNETIHMLF